MDETREDADDERRHEARNGRFWHAVYQIDDVRAALGMGKANPALASVDLDDLVMGGGPGSNRERLHDLLDGGDDGCWRRLAHPNADCVRGVAGIGARAPHLREVTAFVTDRVLAAMATATPIRLPPTLLLGPPGVGKSWYMARLAKALGVPFRSHPMNLSTTADGLSGSHPVWRSSAPGLVARTLMQEEVANPLVLIDEVDKPPLTHRDGDPYRPLYTLLEPECARAFIDEHMQMPFDASAVMWVMSANDLGPLPGPILDRLTVIEVPEMSRDDRMTVVASVYADANARYYGFFDIDLADHVLERLASGNPRRARFAVENAMVRAAADGRQALTLADVSGTVPSSSKRSLN